MGDFDWMTRPPTFKELDSPIEPEGLTLDDLLTDNNTLETHKLLASAKKLTSKLKRSYLRAMNNEKIAEFLRVPEPGEAIHLITNGNYDYFYFVTYLLKLLGRPAEQFYGITWTMHETAVLELLRLLDGGQLGTVSLLTSTHFKNTKSGFALKLIEGLHARGMRYRAIKSHAKVVCLAAPPHYLTLEGSANWTRYPGAEQNLLVNDEKLFRFHAGWMEQVFSET